MSEVVTAHVHCSPSCNSYGMKPARRTRPLRWLSAGVLVFGSACSSGPVEESPTIEPSTSTPEGATPTPTGPTPTEAVNTPTPAGDTPTPEAGPEGFAVIITSNYAEGKVSTVGLESFDLGKDVLSVGGDSVSTWEDGRLYLLERNFGAEDFLHIHEADPDLTRIKTVSLGVGVVPQDLKVLEGKAYLSLYKGKGVRILDPVTGETLGAIDLSAYADGDGDCEASRMLVHDGKLYVTLQRVDYTQSFEAQAPGMIAVIDPASDTVETIIETDLFNLHELYVASDGKGYVSGIGLYGVADGGIERLDLGAATSEGVILDDEDLGSTDKSQFAVAGVYGYLPSGGKLLVLDLEQGKNLGALAVLESESLASVSSDALGHVWVASGVGEVWVIDPELPAVLTPAGLDISRSDYSVYDFSFVDWVETP